MSDVAGPRGGRIRIASHDRNQSVSAPTGEWLTRRTTAALLEGETRWLDYRRERGAETEWNVPLPIEPGRYELIVAARTKEGLRDTQRLVLDTRRSVTLRAETPDRLQVGDRTVCGLTILNRFDRPFAADLELVSGRPLSLTTVEQVGPTGTVEPIVGGAGYRVTVPAESTLLLNVHFEAVQPGSGMLVCSLKTLQVTRTTSAAYEVAPEPGEPTPADWALVRRFFKVEVPAALGAVDVQRGPFESHDAPDLRNLARVELSPGQRLRIGDVVLVQDEIRLPSSLPQLNWVQSAPANCFTYNLPDEALRRIGRRMSHRRGGSEFRATQLAPGRHIHEFLLVCVRPGACVVPLPALTAGDDRVGILGTADHRLIVEASGL